MKSETIVLFALFFACLTLCTLILGAMLSLTPASIELASPHDHAASCLAVTSPCTPVAEKS